MNCLHIDPNKLIKKLDIKQRDFDYTFLKNVIIYNIPVETYYDYLLSIETFQLKNIWNILIRKWNNMKIDLKDNDSFLKSHYVLDNYHQIHNNIEDNELNDILNDFVKEDILKGLFLCNIIQGCIFPK
jgi:hypothetical protein